MGAPRDGRSEAAKAAVVPGRYRLGFDRPPTLPSPDQPIPTRTTIDTEGASCGGARLATRNVGDFEDCGIPVVNPWEASAV